MIESRASYLDFAPEGHSYERAKEEGITIRPRGKAHYLVRLTGSENAHVVCLAKDYGTPFGYCECKGFQYGEGPCAHLHAAVIADTQGVVSLPEVDDILASSPACPVCGADAHREEQ